MNKRRVYRYVTPDMKQLDLRTIEDPLLILERPTVDGRPVPADTILVPGKLDTLAITMATTADAHQELPAPSKLWTPIAVPAHDWLTVFHTDIGLCHIRWHKGRRPEGTSYPTEIRVLVPDGFDARGSVSVFPMWKGTGRVRTMPHDVRLRQRLDGRRALRFPSLPPGWYTIDVRAELKKVTNGHLSEPQVHADVHITAEQPKFVHRLR